MISTPHVHVFSPYHFEIHWPAMISKAILFDMITCKSNLTVLLEEESYRLAMGYHVLAVYFEKPGNVKVRKRLLENALNASDTLALKNRKRWEIPVCYEASLAQDLAAFCRYKGLEKEQLVDLHTSPRYLIHFFGFLPGFMYLGGLEKNLHHPRKENPDGNIPAGSVAIGGQQTGVYPIQSPGGWHVIGRCPIHLIQKDQLPPFQPGDEIVFTSITLKEFKAFKDKPAKDLYHENI